MTGVCSLCATAASVHAHHVTGRSIRGGAYLDASLTLKVCSACHTGAGGVHPLLRTVGVEWPAPGVHPLAHRLRRVALHAELLADADRPFILAPVSSRALAALLREAAAVIGGAR